MELRSSNEAIYNKLNGCFRAVQSNDLQSSKYWLTQIEQMVLSMFNHYTQEKEKVRLITKQVQELCQYSTTIQSSSFSHQIGEWFNGSTQEQQYLKRIVQDLKLSNLVSLPIQEFCSLLTHCQIATDKAKQLEAELTIQKMITLIQRNLMGDDQLKDFFKQRETTDIISLFQSHDLIWNKHKSLGLLHASKISRSARKQSLPGWFIKFSSTVALLKNMKAFYHLFVLKGCELIRQGIM